MPTIANLGIAGAGLATAGGLVGGGYFVLKNDPKPVAKLLEIRKRQLLEKGKDDAEWKIGWQNYRSANMEDVAQPEEAIPPEPKKPKPTTPKRAPKNNDIWALKDWNTQKESEEEKVPESFQDKCIEKSKEKQNGIWTNEFKQFESFCTKASASDDD